MSDFNYDLRELLGTLEGNERSVVVWWLKGYRPREIAENLGVSEPTVYRIRAAALQHLKPYADSLL
jgi:DNA-binding CsgD family transcriptional regulator